MSIYRSVEETIKPPPANIINLPESASSEDGGFSSQNPNVARLLSRVQQAKESDDDSDNDWD